MHGKKKESQPADGKRDVHGCGVRMSRIMDNGAKLAERLEREIYRLAFN